MHEVNEDVSDDPPPSSLRGQNTANLYFPRAYPANVSDPFLTPYVQRTPLQDMTQSPSPDLPTNLSGGTRYGHSGGPRGIHDPSAHMPTGMLFNPVGFTTPRSASSISTSGAQHWLPPLTSLPGLRDPSGSSSASGEEHCLRDRPVEQGPNALIGRQGVGSPVLDRLGHLPIPPSQRGDANVHATNPVSQRAMPRYQSFMQPPLNMVQYLARHPHALLFLYLLH
jgi:hypothetical protein